MSIVCKEIKCLDHGYIRLIEPYGSDEHIIEAARMSFGGGFRGWEKEEKLLGHLWNNRHTSPFEMAGAILEVKAPIAVFREWHRHRTQSYNEMSARYTPLPNQNYVPTVDRLMRHSKTNKQAGKTVDIDLDSLSASQWLDSLQDGYDMCEKIYQEGLARGVPKELARLILPVGRYSAMRANANLLNWCRFMGLRSNVNPAAQEEIRIYGEGLRSILTDVFPRSLALFNIKPI